MDQYVAVENVYLGAAPRSSAAATVATPLPPTGDSASAPPTTFGGDKDMKLVNGPGVEKTAEHGGTALDENIGEAPPT